MVLSFAILAGTFAVIAAVLLYAYLQERQKSSDAVFVAAELTHALRKIIMRCPKCNGGGRLYIPGGTVGCAVCSDARFTLKRIAEKCEAGA